MYGAMEINLPGGQYRERGLESAGSGARVLGELEPILLPGLEFQSPGLQSVEKKVRMKEKGTKGCLLGQEI